MTTITRYKNLIVTDNIYVDVIGTEVVKSRGPHKLYKHPNFNAICAISGSVPAAMFQLLNRHATNFIANLKDYPKTDISVLELQKEFKESALVNEQLAGFEFAAYTKDVTLFIHYAKISKEFTLQIKPADTLFVIGTGADVATKTQVYTAKNPDFTAIDVARIATRTDTFTGNQLFVFDISELGDL